jgi:outer membrane protein OmpA-like peptidoglycan-associated protein
MYWKMLLFSISCYYYTVCFPGAAQAQNNVINGDFELVNICKEYNSGCAPKGWFTSHDIGWSYQNNNIFRACSGYKGSRCIFVLVKSDAGVNKRAYWQSELISPLTAQATYRISFVLKPCNTQYYGNLVQVAFFEDKQYLDGEKMISASNLVHLTVNDAKRKIRDGWVTYSFKYVARGDEKWIMLGNFLNDQAIDGQPLEKSNTHGALYAVDNLSIIAERQVKITENEYAARIAKLFSYTARHEIHAVDTLVLAQPVAKEAVIPNTIHKQDTLSLPDILFLYDSYNINPAFSDSLLAIADSLKSNSVEKIFIQGHTDNYGDSSYNYQLSVNRANEIYQLLMKLGVEQQKIVVEGFGSERPITDNLTEEHRRRNRRVEVIILRK